MKVLCFGEILWDVFPEEKKIGGAPLNFAAHLVKNGVDSAVFSAVGKDALGAEATAIIKKLGIDTAYIAEVQEETGVCLVTLKDGIPDYNIKLGTAMDAIPALELTEQFDALYFGSLAQRSMTSRAALQALLAAHEFKDVFVDINIRQHYYDREVLESSFAHATILKMSREELGVLKETGICAAESFEEICAQLSARYPRLRQIIITLDSDGAYVYENGKQYYSQKPNCTVVSTVGAGDSFSATFLASVLKGEGTECALTKASKVSQYVVTQLGAVPDYPEDLLG